MEIMLKNKCCLYVIISIRSFSITICKLLIESPSYMPQIYDMGPTAISLSNVVQKLLNILTNVLNLLQVEYMPRYN